MSLFSSYIVNHLKYDVSRSDGFGYRNMTIFETASTLKFVIRMNTNKKFNENIPNRKVNF